MITFMEPKEKTKETEKCLDSQLWHACAGSMVQMPNINSKVFYFPQGHAEHASGTVDFRNFPRIPALIPCKVSEVKFMADPETDEVFSRIRLVPLTHNEVNFDDDASIGPNGSDNQDKPTSFAKTLTQSDANNGGGFSVPRYCAETIFPRLDYSADPPVQTILAKDVHGETWKFRHIYRGTPRRHLLTTGWSTFVNHKKLVAGDSIVFLRAENGDLCVGVRRAKRGIGGGPEISTGWNPNYVAPPYGGLSGFFREDEAKLHRNGNAGNANSTNVGKVKPEDVIEAANLASNGQPFNVVYYPRASTPEFCVKASLVNAALQLRWCSGMRFKMAFETEDSSRISWFMGTISSVQPADTIRWPDSPWRLLQVAWDEPDLLQNVKRVSPWLVELVSNMPPSIQLSPFSPPLKKLRLPRQQPEFEIPLPSFNNNNFIFNNPFVSCLPNNNSNSIPAGMQGARHNNASHQYALSLSSDLYFNHNSSKSFPMGFLPSYDVTRAGASTDLVISSKPGGDANVSCLLTMGNSSSLRSTQSDGDKKEAPFLLFGKQIRTEKQISTDKSSSCEGNAEKEGNGSASDGSGSGLDGFQSELTGHCKVFLESEDVGRTLDLTVLSSYEQVYEKLEKMFAVEISDLSNRVQYRDASGTVRQLGDEPFSGFVKGARRLTIQSSSSSDNAGV